MSNFVLKKEVISNTTANNNSGQALLGAHTDFLQSYPVME